MKSTHTARLRLATTALTGLLAIGAFAVSPALSPAMSEPVPYSGTGMRVETQTSTAKTEVLNLAKGRSAVIDLPVDASDVFVSDPAVADAVLRTPRRIFVLGVAAGQSDAIFFDRMGRQILNLSIRVDKPTDELSDTMHRLFPDAKIEVQALNGHIILSGMAQNDGQADQITRLAQTFVDKPEDVVNMMAIAGKDQVMLKVRIVEVNRNTIKQLGFTNLLQNTSANGVSYGFQQTATYGVNNALLGGSALSYADKTAAGLSLASNLSAFERVGLVRTLAEPNLTSVSGEAAKFLAGGEFPVPTSVDSQGHVSVEYKPFGVGLGFTPVVLSSGLISLKISTEVSELTNIGSLTVGQLNLPGLSVRRASDTVEMQSGSSMMIAGLLQSKYKAAIDSLPGLTSLPVLGALFRSRDFQNDETEMVVIVTPYIVSPSDPDHIQTPADNLQPSNDLSSVFMGRLNAVISPAQGAPGAPPPAPYQAPIGYVIE
ncbi:type II and III secretion system protein family protein [Asticcacaulis sp. EMRT-3]|uniref:type II and III secretion system protein family protein n=1 Tax=Asticcacaulis sp. EMRT-3 TaxID=3040349 RepID=UPI0024AED40D|nr:type II and III secretion system protein family protein [Asticcacaulis sp. EMRT-3]MDI7776020.1 type II and III secretion system protein family protein [Asticcacaulis sp. EMRT-3]